MLGWFLKLFLGSHNERVLKKYWPLVHAINAKFDEMDDLSDEQIQAKTAEFRQRLLEGETLDDLMTEAFAVVKQACKRHVGKEWMACGMPVKWVEVPYDVQIIGGIALHQGKIAEMATGEGKTLSAILPLYLNGLEGKGAHLVTVNDYLAQRDSQWTGRILEWLGLRVGCLVQDQPPSERRQQYACDVTYGQNSEFGFDYLRDNMASNSSQLVQGARSHTAQELADIILARLSELGGQVIADRFQTLIVQATPAQVVELLENFGPCFGVDHLEIYWPGEKAEAEIPSLPEWVPPVEERFSVDTVAEGQAQLRFQFFSRDHHFAIVDEVDSILIDEARTPLIISGQVDRSTHRFDQMRPLVETLVRHQANLVNKLLGEAEALLKEGEQESRYKGGMKLLQVKKAMPKNKRLMKHLSDPDTAKLVGKCENDFIVDQKSKMGERSMGWVEEELFFVIDEKGHSVDMSELGRETVSPDNPDRFLLTDLVDAFADLENEKEVAPEEKEKRKEQIRQENEMKSEELHNISQLLRAYTLFEQDVDYVVQENKVIIVDEFTGRLQPGRRFSDGLHQALEAKERVKIEKETQTLASITIQNYFRMYDKLSGMTGTAETEAAEFGHTYKMDVMVIPTHRPVIRNDMDDMIYRTRREKYNAAVEEIIELNKKRLPVLVGTVSVDSSELLSRMLKRAGVSHSVLNAKHHQREAEIVLAAGQPGAVTIATNMAGRGTDIKLGEGVIRYTPDGKLDPEEPGGLQIIGTERHESRRIDRQLRGRAGRQGDPGSSRFYLSLEDDLMRLFGSERISGILQRMGLEEGEEIQHKFITRAITRAQRRIEGINFERRKRTLDYDNVMNKQRETIYSLRRDVLTSEDMRDFVLELSLDALAAVIQDYEKQGDGEIAYDLPGFEAYVQSMAPGVDLEDLERPDIPDEEYLDAIVERLGVFYDRKREAFGPELNLELSRYVVLHVIDDHWRDHLHGIDELREGIHLRSYAQLDPLIEYQREATFMFKEMMAAIQKVVFEHLFRATVAVPQQQSPQRMEAGRGQMQEALPQGEGQDQLPGPADQQAKPRTYVRELPKVGRNDPCPCGSGKKYKKCCGKNEA